MNRVPSSGPTRGEMALSERKYWHWFRWPLLFVSTGAGFAACTWMVTVHPKEDVLPFEKNFPKLSANPSQILRITGSLPQTLPIQFLAYYSTFSPSLDKSGFESCYRNIPLGPSIPLHLSETLETISHGSDYEMFVKLDRYEPGICGWRLTSVNYRILNSLNDKQLASEPGWYGTPIVQAFPGLTASVPGNDKRYWRGRVDVWCLKEIRAPGALSEACSVLGGFSPNYSSLIPIEQTGGNASTTLFSDTRSVEINFHDLSALVDGKPRND